MWQPLGGFHQIVDGRTLLALKKCDDESLFVSASPRSVRPRLRRDLRFGGAASARSLLTALATPFIRARNGRARIRVAIGLNAECLEGRARDDQGTGLAGIIPAPDRQSRGRGDFIDETGIGELLYNL